MDFHKLFQSLATCIYISEKLAIAILSVGSLDFRTLIFEPLESVDCGFIISLDLPRCMRNQLVKQTRPLTTFLCLNGHFYEKIASDRVFSLLANLGKTRDPSNRAYVIDH